jgi:hypothetical protein
MLKIKRTTTRNWSAKLCKYVSLTNPSGLAYNADMISDGMIRKVMIELGRRGGSAVSKAKARAARMNGRKGGRPKKKRNEVSKRKTSARGTRSRARELNS